MVANDQVRIPSINYGSATKANDFTRFKLKCDDSFLILYTTICLRLSNDGIRQFSLSSAYSHID